MPFRPDAGCLSFETASVHDWQACMAYDLITCVHGLHYIGDKLGWSPRAVAWLAPDGLFIGHLDVANLRITTRRGTTGQMICELEQSGLEYDRRRRLISCRGRRSLVLPFSYEGADDSAGPNATGQPAIDSYYSLKVDGSP